MTQQPLLGGRYDLDQVIGRGGMAEVWSARDVRLGRSVAVKRLRVDLATDPTFQARFRREAQSAAGLNHPNIVATYDTGEEVDEKTGIAVPYIVMELVEGHTLRELLRGDRRIRPEKALEWTQQVLDALNHSHRAGIIHRDIKPANVMLTPSGVVKVMDFGIARAVADTSATMTQTAAVIGTAQYLSPEQARGETVDSRSDIYSAGCLLYELLTGRPPFVGDSPVSVAYQHVREAPVPPSTLDPELTPEMDAIVLKSLAKDPADRYQTGKEMRDDIARLLAGEPVTAQLPSVTEPAAPTALTQVVDAPPQPEATSTTPAVTATGVQDVVQEEPRKRSVVGWVIAALVAALLAVAAYGVYTFLKPSSESVTVPAVIGFNEQAATSTLKSAGLGVKVEHVTSDQSATVGQVTKQDPNGGSKAPKGSSVDIVINDGPKTSKLPTSIIGMTEKDARAALVKAGFTAGNISTTQASSSEESQHLDFKQGQVVTSNPAPGADVDAATQKVVLKLATGRSPAPALTQMTVGRAKQVAQAAGFSVSADDAKDSDMVVTQDPKAGASAERDQPIRLTVSTSQDVPDVTGKTQSEAVATLQSAGFTVRTTTVPVTSSDQDGIVQSQDPQGGNQADRGATVTIAVGTYQASQQPSPTATQTTSSAPPSPPPSAPTSSQPSGTSTP